MDGPRHAVAVIAVQMSPRESIRRRPKPICPRSPALASSDSPNLGDLDTPLLDTPLLDTPLLDNPLLDTHFRTNHIRF